MGQGTFSLDLSFASEKLGFVKEYLLKLQKGKTMKYDYTPRGVCTRGIYFDIEAGKVTNIEFDGGCDGNLKAIATLVDGMSAQEISKKLAGNTCGHRSTSCADQLAKAVLEAEAKANS